MFKNIVCLLFFSTSVFAQTRPLFSKSKIQVGSKVIEVEVADQENEWAHGLMFKKDLGKDDGMLFIFPNSEDRSFWMKNTFVALTIGYFDKDLKLINTVDMKPVASEMETNLPSYKSAGPAQYALEMNQGWFQKNNIKPGALLKILSHPKK